MRNFHWDQVRRIAFHSFHQKSPGDFLRRKEVPRLQRCARVRVEETPPKVHRGLRQGGGAKQERGDDLGLVGPNGLGLVRFAVASDGESQFFRSP